MIMVLTGMLANIYMLYNCKVPDKHYFYAVLLQPVILPEMRFLFDDLSRDTHLLSRDRVITNTRSSDSHTVFLMSVWDEGVSSMC